MTAPVLLQFARTAAPAREMPSTYVDQKTGLLTLADGTALIEAEMFAFSKSHGAHLATIVTATMDPADPDLVRFESPNGGHLATIITRQQAEPSDPDRVRGDLAVRAFASVLTESKDPYDPDTVRLSRLS